MAPGFVNHVVGLVGIGLGSNALQLSFSTELGRRAWVYLTSPTVDVRRAEAKYILRPNGAGRTEIYDPWFDRRC